MTHARYCPKCRVRFQAASPAPPFEAKHLSSTRHVDPVTGEPLGGLIANTVPITVVGTQLGVMVRVVALSVRHPGRQLTYVGHLFDGSSPLRYLHLSIHGAKLDIPWEQVLMLKPVR